MNVAVCPRYALSICAGVGAFDLALELAFPGTVTACFVEREIAAVEVLVARMEEGSLPLAPIYSNLLRFDGKPWRRVIHYIIAGLPCQPYSVAGKKLGHDDERAIWPAFIRVVGEVQPEVVFLENVPAFLRYFRPVGNELQRLGYIVAEPLLLTAAECGAAHRRERFFAMAYRQSGRLGELRQPSGRDGLADGSNAALVDAARHERPGPHGETGTWRGVREAGDELADTERKDSGGQPDASLGSEIRRTTADRNGAAVADAGDGLLPLTWRGAGRRDGTGSTGALLEDTGTLGNPDLARLERREFSGCGLSDERIAGETGNPKLADAGRERDERRGVSGDVARASGTTEGERLQRERRGNPAGSGLPLFAPGPGAVDLWREVLVRYPWLRPASSQAEALAIVRGMAPGDSDWLDFEDRTDRLRSIGNLVCPLQASVAITVLARRAGLM